MDKWEARQQITTARRTKCLESNGYRCSVCGGKFDRAELYTQPDDNACFCGQCWLCGVVFTKYHRRGATDADRNS